MKTLAVVVLVAACGGHSSSSSVDASAGSDAALSDAEHTRIILVALPEATPVHEALELQADLARAGLRPYTWVANSALSATSTTDPILRARAAQENRWLGEIQAASPRSPVIVPWAPRTLVGRDGLRPLTA